jgi:hypothetical protein
MSLPTTVTDCFTNIIGLRGLCTDETSDSGLYANEIGISVNELNDFLTEDYPSAKDFFDKQKDFAVKIITKQIHAAMQEKYRAATVLSNQRIGFFQNNLSIQSGVAGYYKGVHLELTNEDSFLDFFLNAVSVQLTTTTTITMYVIDLIQGVIIDSFTVDAVANEIVVKYVNKTYKSDRKVLNLFIGYVSTGLSANNTITSNVSGCRGCSDGIFRNAFVEYSAAKLSTSASLIDSSIVATSETGGVSLMYNVSCNHTDWLCSISNVIALPILYKTAALIMGFGIRNSGNEQINTRNTMNIEKLKEREAAYEFAYREEMDNLLKNINVPSDERCYVCRSRSRTVVMLP